ncbi:hypothetical protein [Solibacillus isronensis]|uniref:hypothetical protein n=1 Tax=Solibacillus isronensis TaxID=412383 RepID=UPI0009A6D965|nr:hypothetical protein [Solibacillus isronensis]
MKKLKYVLIALAVIVLGVAGYLVYELKFKSYDTADTEVDALLEETFEVALPDGSVILVDKDGNIVDNKADNSADKVAGSEEPSDSTGTTNESDETTEVTTGSKTVTSSNAKNSTTATSGTNTNTVGSTTASTNQQTKPGSSTSPKEKVMVSTIKAQYTPTFSMIENQARDRINGLISQAYNEYSTKKKNGESIKYGYFYRKYMGAANALESSTDATVKTVVGLVEKDLQANGFDKSYAQTFMEEYKATKKALRDDLMDKAMSFR